MPAAPELRLAIEEKRGVMDIFTLWMPRIALVLAFVFIGGTKFNNDPRGEWASSSSESAGDSGSAISPARCTSPARC